MDTFKIFLESQKKERKGEYLLFINPTMHDLGELIEWKKTFDFIEKTDGAYDRIRFIFDKETLYLWYGYLEHDVAKKRYMNHVETDMSVAGFLNLLFNELAVFDSHGDRHPSEVGTKQLEKYFKTILKYRVKTVTG